MHVNGYAITPGANLRYAYLADVNLRGANLTGADLRYAYLAGAYLTGANLTDADLRGANLTRADLRYADLRNTCLDPSAIIPPVADACLQAAGLEVVGDRVYGYRTRFSRHVGKREYNPGGRYTAPVFSVAGTSCHPGLYLASNDWLDANHYSTDRVRCWCYRKDIHKAGDKFRARKLHICRE